MSGSTTISIAPTDEVIAAGVGWSRSMWVVSGCGEECAEAEWSVQGCSGQLQVRLLALVFVYFMQINVVTT